MYVFIGWLNIAIFVIMTAPFWLRFLNTHLFHLKGGAYLKVIKVLRRIHKPIGVGLLVLAVIHGYLALGSLRLHTGLLVLLAAVVTAVFGLFYYLFKKKTLLRWHRAMVVVTLLFVVIHLLFPSALFYLLP